MNAEDALRSRSLAVVALLLAATTLAIGVQQVGVRTDDVETDVLAPLAVAVAFGAAVVLAGRAVSGSRRTPYW